MRQVDPQADPVTRTFQVRRRPDRSARGDAARRDGDRAPAARARRRASSIPASALTATDRQPAVWIVDPANLTVALRNVEVLRFDPATAVISQRARRRRDRGDGRRSGAASGPEGPAARSDFVSGLNLSDWALKHRSFIVFIDDRGRRSPASSSYFQPRPRRGSAPSPSAPWSCRRPGPARRIDDTLQQVTERLERKLQETQGPRFPAQLHQPRPDHDLRQPEGLDDRLGSAGHLVPGAQEHRRHPRHAAGRRGRARLQRRFRRHLRHHLRLHRRRLHPSRAARLCRGHPLAACCRCRTSRRSRSSARRTSRSSSSSRPSELAGLGIDRAALIAALQAQNAVSPAGAIQTGDEKLSLRVSGAFQSEKRSARRQLPVQRPADPAARHRDGPARLSPIRRSRCSASTASRRSASPSPCATAATFWRSAATSRRRSTTASPICRSASTPTLVSDQPVVVQTRDRRVHGIAVAGDRHHHGGQLRQPRLAAGRGGGAVDSADAWRSSFRSCRSMHIDLQRISLGALIIALGLLVDDAMTTIDVMTSRLAAGDSKEKAATFAYKTLALPMLTGTFVTIAGFVPIGFARSVGRRIHVLDLRRGGDRADRVLVRRGAVRAAARRLAAQEAGQAGRRRSPASSCATFRSILRRRDARCAG